MKTKPDNEARHLHPSYHEDLNLEMSYLDGEVVDYWAGILCDEGIVAKHNLAL